MVGIYKITNPNGRLYIGQSSNIEVRWSKYKILACKDQPSIYNSLKKYGYENHIFEVIEECTLEKLDEKEIYWGIYFNVLSNKHLNNRLGRGYGSLDSEETKLKKSISNKGKTRNKGKKFSDQHKENISKSKKGHVCYNDIWRNKIGKAKLGKPNLRTQKGIDNFKKLISKPILQIDPLTNIVICEFRSSIEAAISIGKNKSASNNIRNVANGKVKTAYKFIWEYKN